MDGTNLTTQSFHDVNAAKSSLMELAAMKYDHHGLIGENETLNTVASRRKLMDYESRRFEIDFALAEKSANFRRDCIELSRVTIQNAHYDLVRHIFAKIEQYPKFFEEGTSILQDAIRSNPGPRSDKSEYLIEGRLMIDAVGFLICHGAPVNSSDEDGCTPLRLSCQYGYAETFRLMLDAGADPQETVSIADETQQSGTRSINLLELTLEQLPHGHTHLPTGYQEVISHLQQLGLKANPSNPNWIGLFEIFCYQGNVEAAKQIYKQGVHLEISPNSPSTPTGFDSAMHAAVSGGHVAAVRFLLDVGVQPSLKVHRQHDFSTSDPYTPIVHAIDYPRGDERDSYDAYELLIDNGADEADGRHLLEMCVRKGWTERCRRLLDKGIRLKKIPHGVNVEVVELLCESGAELDGPKFLEYVFDEGMFCSDPNEPPLDLVRYLYEKHSVPIDRDFFGRAALCVMRQRSFGQKHMDLIHYLMDIVGYDINTVFTLQWKQQAQFKSPAEELQWVSRNIWKFRGPKNPPVGPELTNLLQLAGKFELTETLPFLLGAGALVESPGLPDTALVAYVQRKSPPETYGPSERHFCMLLDKCSNQTKTSFISKFTLEIGELYKVLSGLKNARSENENQNYAGTAAYKPRMELGNEENLIANAASSPESPVVTRVGNMMISSSTPILDDPAAGKHAIQEQMKCADENVIARSFHALFSKPAKDLNIDPYQSLRGTRSARLSIRSQVSSVDKSGASKNGDGEHKDDVVGSATARAGQDAAAPLRVIELSRNSYRSVRTPLDHPSVFRSSNQVDEPTVREGEDKGPLAGVVKASSTYTPKTAVLTSDLSELVQYQYLSLQDTRSIRLFVIEPASSLDDPIVGTLEHRELYHNRSFEALSYVWGTSPERSMIQVSEASMQITLSLDAALRKLRKSDTVRWLWIDAICINQNDDEEKSQQVRMMGDIYRAAQQTLIWVGEHADNSEMIFEHIRRGPQPYLEDIENFVTRQFDTHQIEGSWKHSQYSGETEKAFRVFVERPWFFRTWILQEVASSNIALIICGTDVAELEDIFEPASYLQTPSEFHPFQGREGTAHFRDIMDLRGNHASSQTLRMSRFSKATDPKDKVYGIFGLLGSQLIPIDYGRSVEQIYRDFAQAIYEQDNNMQALHWLGTGRSSLNLPSWVPDWSISEPVGCLLVEDVRMVESEDFPTEFLYTHFDGDDLIIAGKHFAQVHIVGEELPVKPEYKPGSDGFRRVIQNWEDCAGPLIQAFGLAALEDFARTLNATDKYSDHWKNPGQTLVPEYVMWDYVYGSGVLRQGMDRLFSQILVFMGGSFQATADKPVTTPWNGSVYTKESLESDFCYYAQRMEAVCYGRRFFTTKNCAMGLAPPDTRPGDLLVFFLGGIYPFVVRPTEDGKHRLIGDCFLKGFDTNKIFFEKEDSISIDVFRLS